MIFRMTVQLLCFLKRKEEERVCDDLLQPQLSGIPSKRREGYDEEGEGCRRERRMVQDKGRRDGDGFIFFSISPFDFCYKGVHSA